MSRLRFAPAALAALFLAFATPAAAQEPAAPAARAEAAVPAHDPMIDTAHVAEAPGAAEGGDFITPHITDSYWLEVPGWPPWRAREICIGKLKSEHECVSPLDDFSVDLGLFTLQGNFWPTRHVVMMLLAATIVAVLLIGAGRAARRQTAEAGHTKGFAGAIEAVVLYLRDEVILPNVGHHGEGFVPYLLAIFFFILGANILGLIPFGATATGNIAVTATLAIMTFLVIEVAGMRANGVGYLNTVIYWNTELPLYMRIPLAIIMSPIEVIGKLTKPFALAIRLFANMTAGHIVLLALIGLIFSFGSYAIAGAPALMAVAINMLELFVAFLQAFIFTLLSSVFIGQIREAHH
jgi:F-type H+-transporting ATPase subunit a